MPRVIHHKKIEPLLSQRALKGLLFISGLRGLMGSANKSSSASLGFESPVLGEFEMPITAALSEMAAKEETATSLPCGDRV